MGAGLEQGPDGRVRLSGELSLQTVPDLWPRLQRLTAGPQPLTVDLGAVERTDSGALVLLLELIERVEAQGGEIRLLGLPDSLRALARLSNVEGLLGSRS